MVLEIDWAQRGDSHLRSSMWLQSAGGWDWSHLECFSPTYLEVDRILAGAVSQNTYTGPPHVAWVSSQHDYWVPRASVTETGGRSSRFLQAWA